MRGSVLKVLPDLLDRLPKVLPDLFDRGVPGPEVLLP